MFVRFSPLGICSPWPSFHNVGIKSCLQLLDDILLPPNLSLLPGQWGLTGLQLSLQRLHLLLQSFHLPFQSWSFHMLLVMTSFSAAVLLSISSWTAFRKLSRSWSLLDSASTCYDDDETFLAWCALSEYFSCRDKGISHVLDPTGTPHSKQNFRSWAFPHSPTR